MEQYIVISNILWGFDVKPSFLGPIFLMLHCIVIHAINSHSNVQIERMRKKNTQPEKFDGLAQCLRTRLKGSIHGVNFTITNPGKLFQWFCDKKLYFIFVNIMLVNI